MSVPPTIEEVVEYCKSRDNLINPYFFHNFYTMKGWKVGRSKIVDWRAAVRAWEGNKDYELAVAKKSTGSVDLNNKIAKKVTEGMKYV